MNKPISEKLVFVGVYLPESLSRKLKSVAALSGETKNNFHRRLIEDHFNIKRAAK